MLFQQYRNEKYLWFIVEIIVSVEYLLICNVQIHKTNIQTSLYKNKYKLRCVNY